MKTVLVQTRIDAKLHRELKSEAKKRGVSVAATLRGLIENMAAVDEMDKRITALEESMRVEAIRVADLLHRVGLRP